MINQHAARTVGDRGRDRDRLADHRLLRAGPRPLHHDGLERRGRAHGRAVQPVRHHRARRVDPDHRRDRAGLPWNAENGAAFVVAFMGSVAMWAVYFNIGAERASRIVASRKIPGGMARSGYTYIHILIVAGIILAAVGDELVLQHPAGHSDAAQSPRSSAGRRSISPAMRCSSGCRRPICRSRTCGPGTAGPAGAGRGAMPPLVLAAGTTAVLIIVVIWEWMSLRQPGAGATATR